MQKYDIEDKLHIPPESVTGELIPALRRWDRLLERRGIDRQLWFIFGSAVNRAIHESLEQETHPLLEAFGMRVKPNVFRPASDIDVGLVVADGQSWIDLKMNRTNSPFRTARAAGHILELTRFEESWVSRRDTSVEELRGGNQQLGIYGVVVPVEL